MPVLSTFGAAAARGFGWLFQAAGGGTGGSLYAWGFNSNGQLGQGDTTSYSSPVQVGALATWANVSGSMGATSRATLATKSDGTIWAWGSGDNGRLGLGNTTNYSSPVQVGALTNWSQPKACNSFGLGLKTDGTLWSWGFNSSGQLGLGDTTNYSSPVQIGSSTTWKFVDFGCAIKTDDTLWMWGANASGQLGQSNTTSYSSPVQVGTLTWSTVSGNNGSTIAIQSNGTLWGWGFNGSGTLGVGNITNYSSPVQIGALTNWSKVAIASSSGGGGHVLAIKTDGTLWAWGGGSSGQIGDGTTTTYSSPVQIGALTTWAGISAGGLFSLAVKTDGTLWAWGSNAQGQLGVSSTTSYSSPIQVGSSTTWFSTKISGGGFSGFGIRS